MTAVGRGQSGPWNSACLKGAGLFVLAAVVAARQPAVAVSSAVLLYLRRSAIQVRAPRASRPQR
eukprot:11177740-Lingulodinium_polyedra.AAC.1